ncbi:MAG: hypothetical protein KBF12_14580 [Sebaldella sp.]|nr:hypothetical protein [Sebaldella sp.]
MQKITTLKETFEYYSRDAVNFFKDVLNFYMLSEDQTKVLGAFNQHRRLSIPAGHSTGKSSLAGGLTSYWLITRPKSRVIVTAPTYRQLKTIYWAEVTKTYNRSKLKDLNLFEINDKIMRINDKDLKREWFALPVTASTPEGMQGQHGDKTEVIEQIMKHLGIEEINDDETVAEITRILKGEKQIEGLTKESKEKLLVMVDESSGVKNEIFEVLEGTDYDKLVLFGNMTKNTGYFYESVYNPKSKFKVIRMSSYKSPFMSSEQIKDLEETYGIDSNVVKVRLKGEAPDNNENGVFESSRIDESFNRRLEIKKFEVIKLGVDAGKGNGRDSTVIYEKKDNKIKKYFEKNNVNLPGVKREIIQYCYKNPQKLIIANVDGTGLGTGLVQELEEQEIGNLIVNDIQFAGKAKKHKEYSNVRTEMYFELRKELQNLDIDEDDELKRELLVQIYEFDDQGRFKLIKKDKMVEILGHSPDKSDALALCNYEFESKNISIRASLEDYY